MDEIRCVLTLNDFIARGVSWLQAWLVVLICVALFACVQHIQLYGRACTAERFICMHLSLAAPGHQRAPCLCCRCMKSFVAYLGPDGVIVLRLIMREAGACYGGEIIGALYELWTAKHAAERQNNGERASAAFNNDEHPNG
jgi:hypothetical protein